MPEDPELAAIRAARLNQLQQTAGGGGGAGGGENEDDGKQRVAEEQMRRDLLATVLEAPARERRECRGITASHLIESFICSCAYCTCQSWPISTN